ncbi:hypothetical protein H4217_002089 [Coemansia sp. RSA 1939]|nr:hypothetical protein H4217_002089 [Coemansia sp. RSA 1939]KAJ2614482.1 hypothetical protein EV177_002027 [Coemansia sp. RSA 1804]
MDTVRGNGDDAGGNEQRGELFHELFGDTSEASSVYDEHGGMGSDGEEGEEEEEEEEDGDSEQTALESLMAEIGRTQPDELAPGGGVMIERPVPGLAVYRSMLGPRLSRLFFEWLSAKYFRTTPVAGIQGSGGEPDGPRINQGMHFGALSDCLTPLGFLAALAAARGGCLHGGQVFDQAIINLYDPGEGIGDHIDLLRFGDGVVGFSFGGSATMRMRELHSAEDIARASRYAHEEGEEDCVSHVAVGLDAGDVYAMAGDARYRWTHGFPATIGGRSNVQSRRISVTLRRLL